MRFTISAASRPCGSVKYRLETWISFLGLLDERLGDGRMRVAEAADGDAAAEVEIALAGDVKNIAALRRGSTRVQSGRSWARHFCANNSRMDS